MSGAAMRRPDAGATLRAAPVAVPSLDELAEHPERAASLTAEAVEKLLVEHATVGAVLLGRLLATRAAEKAVSKPETHLMNAREAAERLRVPRSWISDMARQGKIRSVRLGHYVRFRAEDLDQFVSEHQRED